MSTTIREFQRNFRKMRQKARSGEIIVITDAEGVSYSFQAQRTSAATFGDLAADIAGSYHSGVGDLASNARHLDGYGRK